MSTCSTVLYVGEMADEVCSMILCRTVCRTSRLCSRSSSMTVRAIAFLEVGSVSCCLPVSTLLHSTRSHLDALSPQTCRMCCLFAGGANSEVGLLRILLVCPRMFASPVCKLWLDGALQMSRFDLPLIAQKCIKRLMFP